MPQVWPSQIVQPYYRGRQESIDWVVVHGSPRWGVAARGEPVPGKLGQFFRWTVYSDIEPSVYCAQRDEIKAALPHFTGVVNVESIEGQVVEVHFRPSAEFFPLYGDDVITRLMDTANNLPGDQPARAKGGVVQVIPHHSENGDTLTIDTARDFQEQSWRQQLIYRPDRRRP